MILASQCGTLLGGTRAPPRHGQIPTFRADSCNLALFGAQEASRLKRHRPPRAERPRTNHMHRLLVAALALIVAASVMAVAGAVPVEAAETVTFPGNSVTLTGVLYHPEGSGPFPAVVALHGCGGVNGRSGSLSARHADWADRLVAAGFIVLFPDSFGSRGATGQQCTTRDRVTRPSRERVGDANAARSF